MEFLDLQTALILVVIPTAAAAVVVFYYLRKSRQSRRSQPVKAGTAAYSRHRARIRAFAPTPLDYATAKKPATQLPHPERLVVVSTASQPLVQRRIERETVILEMAPPSLPAPLHSKEAPCSKEATCPVIAPHELTLPPFTINAALWEHLTSSPLDRNLHSSGNTVEASYHMIRDDGQDALKPMQPSGMIQKAVLDKWLDSEPLFTGLVVSIGVNDIDSSMWHIPGLVQSVGSYMADLLQEGDFSCRTSYDEFVMVCPGENVAQSQRRLNHISERLWSYQLSGSSACSILFSWGAVQIQNRSLGEAIASSTERMRETKRSSSLAQSAPAHRQAV